MTKKLLLLDLVLAALVAVLATGVRDKWLDARKREQVRLGVRLKQLPPPPYSPLPVAQPLTAAAYAEIVEKHLFSADRNPTVIVDVTPPPPMPELPTFYGVMNLGDGTLAIMSAKPGQSPREVRLGEKVGEFTLLAANRDEVVLEWDGKKITKKPSELVPKTSGPNAAAEAPAAADNSRSAPAAPKPVAAQSGPGADIGAGYRACGLGDTTPAGTVQDGMKKVVVITPFGPSCHWEAAK